MIARKPYEAPPEEENTVACVAGYRLRQREWGAYDHECLHGACPHPATCNVRSRDTTSAGLLLTAEQIADAYTCPVERVNKWIGPLTLATERCAISSIARQSAFLAQVGHESGRLVYVREIWNPRQCPWQARYEGRKDLGNVHPGDGERFKGRGLIQITGRNNYRDCGAAFGEDFEGRPELLEQPLYAALSAGWFWQAHGCNELADQGRFDVITRVINGGTNGMDDRRALLKSIMESIA